MRMDTHMQKWFSYKGNPPENNLRIDIDSGTNPGARASNTCTFEWLNYVIVQDCVMCARILKPEMGIKRYATDLIGICVCTRKRNNV